METQTSPELELQNEIPSMESTSLKTEEVSILLSEEVGLEGSAEIVAAHEEEVHMPGLIAEEVFSVGGLPITNSLIMSLMTAILLIALTGFLRKNLKEIPGKLQTVFEVAWDEGLKLADQITNHRKLSEKILPISITLFLVILTTNYVGLLPGVGSFGWSKEAADGSFHFIPWLRAGTADINTTLAYAIVSVIASNVFGFMMIGAWKFFNRFFNVKVMVQMVKNIKKNPQAIITAPIQFFVGVIEIVGELAKFASLSFRLFGNIFAGEMLLAAMGGIFLFLLPAPFYALELLAGFIQAFVFATLTLIYFSMAAHDHDDEEGGHDDHIAEDLEDAGYFDDKEAKNSA